jgi:putative Mn2+ efflux pump MntP
MDLWELFFVAVGLSMDAFAVAVCKGLSTKELRIRHAVMTGLFFGGFQAFMPLVGYLLGAQFKVYITAVDHWIVFALLSLIGLNMIRESRHGSCENPFGSSTGNSFGIKSMLMLSVATSIDALAVGVSFAFLHVEIIRAVFLIGVTTFILSAVGVKVGNILGAKIKSGAETAGGIILIAMGIKILIEHLGA